MYIALLRCMNLPPWFRNSNGVSLLALMTDVDPDNKWVYLDIVARMFKMYGADTEGKTSITDTVLCHLHSSMSSTQYCVDDIVLCQ
jgi:hypothetical protein